MRSRLLPLGLGLCLGCSGAGTHGTTRNLGAHNDAEAEPATGSDASGQDADEPQTDESDASSETMEDAGEPAHELVPDAANDLDAAVGDAANDVDAAVDADADRDSGIPVDASDADADAEVMPDARFPVTLLTDHFSSATPVGGSNLAGTAFLVVTQNVDVVGNINGSFYTCGVGANNCIDLVGETAKGKISSIASFNLVAGRSYLISWAQANSPQAPPDGYILRVTLGSFTADVSVGNQTDDVFGPKTRTFVPSTNESNVHLSFEALTQVNTIWGPKIDDIGLVEQ